MSQPKPPTPREPDSAAPEKAPPEKGPPDGSTRADAVTALELPLAQFHSNEAASLLLKYEHVERLIGKKVHHPSEGDYCEDLIRELLRELEQREQKRTS